MVPLIPWVERQWTFNLPTGAFPAVLERLAGTPARAAALIAGATAPHLAARPAGKWSVNDHLGHLVDLHVLDVQRLGEFLAGAGTLSAADMSNRRTEEGNYRAMSTTRLLRALRDGRRQFVARLEELTEDQIGATARHPRLGVTMRLIDWTEFVAEHDDHHLAAARIALRAVVQAQGTEGS